MTAKDELRLWEKTYLEKSDVDWRKTLKWILNLGAEKWSGIFWLKKNQWRAFVSMIMNLAVSYKGVEFHYYLTDYSFSRMALYCKVS
jgi:hypothetical protein